MRFRNLIGKSKINIGDCGFRYWVAVKPNPVSSKTRTKFKRYLVKQLQYKSVVVFVVVGDMMALTGSAL